MRRTLHVLTKLVLAMLLSLVFLYYVGKITEDNTNESPNKENILPIPLCARNEAYPINPEFSRAISLIIQRYQNTPSEQDGKMSYPQVLALLYKEVINCLDIKYASSKSDINNAEGIFYFSPTSTRDRLSILVSPEYQSKDDLLTAILLAHEIHHAYAFAQGLYSAYDAKEACYRNEAEAFSSQAIFVAVLNPEEQDSFYSRAEKAMRGGNPSQSKAYHLAEQSSEVMKHITASNGDFRTGALGYVKQIPFYQHQCERVN